MKKAIPLVLILCYILNLFVVAGCAAQNATAEDGLFIVLQINNPIMTVNGIQEEIDPGRGTVPLIVNGRTLVPIRAIIETMGGSVAWEESTQTAALSYENNEIRLTLDSTDAYYNEEACTLDVAPTSINDRTMLPIRFIAQRFSFGVDWDEAQQLITITRELQATQAPAAPVASPTPEEEETSTDSNVLVLYFSATGNTKTLAEKIAAAAGADLVEIVPQSPYTSDDLNYNQDTCRANEEITADARPAIEPLPVEVAQYDVILLGYPIWWGQCPPVVRTFLDTYDLAGKTIMPFCTSGSSGIAGSLDKIRELAPDSTITEGFRGTSSTTDGQIRTWLEANPFPGTSSMRMRLITQSGDVIVRLDDNSAAKSLAGMLPLHLDFSDYSQTEKIAYPPEDIDVAGTAAGTAPKAGDLTIYAPWGNLALFYKDGSYSDALIPLGSVEAGFEYLDALEGNIPAELYENAN